MDALTRHLEGDWFHFALRVGRARWVSQHKGYVFLEDEEGHLAKRGSPYECRLVSTREKGQDVMAEARVLWNVILSDASDDAAPLGEMARPQTLFDFAEVQDE